MDMQIYVTCVFFCVAKQKHLNNDSLFYIIMLGTNRLEVMLGILRTMVGNDCHTDMLQLADRLSNIATCASIIQEHPEWDRSPRRRKRPSTDYNGDFAHSHDHLNPASWKGNVCVKNVSTHTRWKSGRKVVKDLCLDAQAFFTRMKEDGRSTFRPYGAVCSAEGGDDDELDDGEEDDDGEGDRTYKEVPGRTGRNH